MGLSCFEARNAELTLLLTAAQSDDTDDSPAMNEIIRRFQSTARRIATTVCIQIANRDDVANAALIALVRAVRRHDSAREGFATYAIKFMRGAARRESTRLGSPEEIATSDDDLQREVDEPRRRQRNDHDASSRSWGAGQTSAFVTRLPVQQRDLLNERYLEDLDLAQIAEKHGVSVSAVSQRLKTAHKHLFKAIRPPTVSMAA